MSDQSNIFDIHTSYLWKDDNIDLLSIRSTGNPNAPEVGSLPGTNIDIALFLPSALTEISSLKEINHDYAEGSLLKPHFHWYPIDAGAGNVVLGFEYWASRNGVTVTDILSVTQAAPGVAYQPMVAIFDDIDLGEIALITTQFHFRLFRDGANVADTYASNIAAGTLGLHYLTNSRGSRQLTVK